MKKAYKIVRVNGGRRMSLRADFVYSVGQWTSRPKGWGPLAVYTSYDVALQRAQMAAWAQEVEVWEVEYQPSQEKSFYRPAVSAPTCGFFGLPGQPVGKDEDAADAVKLVRRVARFEPIRRRKA